MLLSVLIIALAAPALAISSLYQVVEYSDRANGLHGISELVSINLPIDNTQSKQQQQ